MSTDSNICVQVKRHFDAPAEHVFDAWLNPSMIGVWMFGPAVREEKVLHVSVDAQIGGSFSFLVQRDGETIDHSGKYMEIDRPRRLVFTWGIRGESEQTSKVMVELSSAESGCELSLTHELHPDWAEYAERTQAAWAKMVDSLASALSLATVEQTVGTHANLPVIAY